MKKTIKIIICLALGSLFTPLFASAATVTFGNPSTIAYNSTVTVTSNKNTYAPGEAIVLNWSIHPGYGGSLYFYYLRANLNGGNYVLFQNSGLMGGGGTSGSSVLTAPPGNGSYTISFSENISTGFSVPQWNYGSMSFSVAPTPLNPCALPWGGSIPSGSSVTAYQSSSAVSPSVCAPQTRTCTNGSLSGTYTNQACSVSVALTATITAPATNITIPQNTGYNFSGYWTGNANYEYWHYGACRTGVAMGGGSNLAVPITPQTSTMSYFFNIPGTYIVYFGVADTNGNASTCDSRTITVTPAGPPSATLSANPTSCTIASGASTCNVPFTWNILNAPNPYISNVTRGVTYTTAVSGVAQPYPITNGINIVKAFTGFLELANVSVTASCALGTMWNGTLCSTLFAQIDLPTELNNPWAVVQGNPILFSGSGMTDPVTAGLGYSYFVGPGTSPNALAVDTSGNMYTSNGGTNTISKISPSGVVTPFATVGQSPNALTFDSVGNLYTANFTANTVSKVTPGGIVNTFATVGTNPYGLTFDPTGNLYTANFGSNNISKVTPSGVVNTFVTMPPASGPHAIAADSFGNIFVTNHFKATVSKIDPTGVIVATYPVGNNPSALVFDPAGNLYVGPSMGGGIRKITPAGVVSSVGPAGISGDGLAFDALGNLYAADAGAGYLYKIPPVGLPTIHGPLWIPSLKGALYNPLTGGVYTTQPSNGLVKKLTTGINPITEYRWSEGTCGGSVLQSNSSFAFNMPTPTPASRTVFLRIKDSQGQWSTNCPSRTINITPPPVNGACGSSGPFSLAPTTGLCTAGTPSAVPTGSGPWFWDCNGSNGGTNATCSALSAVVPGTCGPSATETNVKPTTGLCNYTATTPTVLGSRPWTWKCTDSAGFGFASCTTTTKCGDGVCQKGTETFLNCPKDCKQKFQQF